jgi:2-polyprenyl-3-methyl-5-hydroxy-6-metoxy-1,4-benzoquinol methylase
MTLHDGEVRTLAVELYQGIPASTFQKLRPLICPFAALIERVPAGASVLDVGCGAGLLLGLLAKTGRLSHGLGFDSNGGAIERARLMRQRLGGDFRLEFERRDVADGWPEGHFDVVSLIDVMHHVPTQHQASVIRLAAARLKPGGLLLYKDMVQRPRWRAFMNRLHDLVLARQWIQYAPIADVAQWMKAAGLQVGEIQLYNTFWYGHELLTATAPSPTA